MTLTWRTLLLSIIAAVVFDAESVAGGDEARRVAAGTVDAPVAIAAAYRRCKNVTIRNPDGSVHTRTHGLFVSRTRCATGRRVARSYLSRIEGNAEPEQVRPFGFRCDGGVDGVACRKGGRRVTWGYYYD